jgi:hypothetical protein
MKDEKSVSVDVANAFLQILFNKENLKIHKMNCLQTMKKKTVYKNRQVN